MSLKACLVESKLARSWNTSFLILHFSLRAEQPNFFTAVSDDEILSENPLIQLFSAYAALCARFLFMDHQTLLENIEDPAVEPDLGSKRMVDHLAALFKDSQIESKLWRDEPMKMMNLSRILIDHNAWAPKDLTFDVSCNFVAPPTKGLDLLSSCVALLLERNPPDWDFIIGLLNCASGIATQAASLSRDNTPFRNEITVQLLGLFKACHIKLHAMLAKQSSSLTHDILVYMLRPLSLIYYAVILMDPQSVDSVQLIESERYATYFNSHQTPADLAELHSYAWKFHLLMKCITNGRMETRVTGVDEMQSDLLHIYNKHVKNAEGQEHAVASFAATFLLEKKVMEYLVGVDSHPRLLSGSKNIIGFLLVTHKYGEKELNMIWNTLLSSQDPRTSEAILNVLSNVVNLADTPVVLQFIEKLMQLPIQSFDAKVMSFCEQIISQKDGDRKPDAAISAPLIHLTIRLLRDSCEASNLPSKIRFEFLNFASRFFRTSYFVRLQPEERYDILRQIFRDAEERPIAFTGSLVILNHLWEHSHNTMMNDLNTLSSPETWVSLIVRDFTRICQIRDLLADSEQDFLRLLDDRLLLVQKVIMRCSAAFDPNSISLLWNHLVGADAASNEARDSAWRMLARAASSTRTQRNSFFDKCKRELFPGLDAAFLTPLLLDFAHQLTLYEDYSMTSETQEEHDDYLPGDIFWHIALNASNQETGHRAIGSFVDRNVSRLSPVSKEVIYKRHARLVERCVKRLIDAATEHRRLNNGSATSDEDSMVIIPSENDIAIAKLHFTRSLFVLKEFMHRIRATQPTSPISVANSSSSKHSLIGEEMVIRYQPHDSGKPTGIFELKIGNQSTLQDLVSLISSKTGFSEMQLIASGQRIDQRADAEVPIGEIQALHSGLLLVRKIPGSKASKGNGVVVSLSPLEQQVMKNFMDLYGLLSLNDELGYEVYYFLETFPPHEDIMALVSDQQKGSLDVFPQDYPYKTLYSVYALKGSLHQKLQEGAPCDDLLRNGVQKLARTLVMMDLPKECELNLLQIKIISSLLDCMLFFLKEPVPSSISDTYFDEPTSFIYRLMEIQSKTLQGPLNPETELLASSCFAACLEACLHCPPMWEHFRQSPSSSTMLRNAWLRLNTPVVRFNATQTIKSICAIPLESEKSKTKDFINFFWGQITSMMREAVTLGPQADQFFHIAIDLFRKIDESESHSLPLATYLEHWTALLLNHEHREFVGRHYVDGVIDGLTNLLHWCLQLLKARKVPLEISSDLMSKLFTSHVFPPVQLHDDNECLKARMPVLHPKTRELLYSLLFSLVTDPKSYHKLVKLLKQLLPAAYEYSYAWSHGLAQTSEEIHYDCLWNLEREKYIRSPTGYAGLKNLSNTCYLNSLLMQLFMNVNFREFVLNIEVQEGNDAQKLLRESKKLFAYLQETWCRAVDPENAVNCISTYDNLPIDIHVQMDVDEFFNVLFDRWESQILSAEDKTKFRKFYGGQLVQQIKSQDCPHISERLEPFSVIQCDIQGKTTLTESLSAFIEGEMMQGGNNVRDFLT